MVSVGMHGYVWLAIALFAVAGLMGYLYRRNRK